MVSFYYYINFRKEDLHMRNYSAPKSGNCSLCKNNYMKHCSCVFEEGNDYLPDMFSPIDKNIKIRGQNIKPVNYYDKAVHYLLDYDIDVEEEKPDVKQFRQW